MRLPRRNISLSTEKNQSTENIPPGIDESNWIAINENCGIVIDHAQVSGTVRRDAEQSKTDIINKIAISYGTIFIKKDGTWYEFIQKLPPPSVQPLM